MDTEYAVLIVDENLHEAALVTSAVRLHDARLEVSTVPDAQAAFHYLRDAKRRLVILGARAIAEGPALLTRPHGAGARHPMVGIAPEILPGVRERALAAGLREVHQRPAGWPEYRELVREILDRWMK
jgi:DNA-binding NtrC family response regulator